MKQNHLDINDLVPMDAYVETHPIVVDVAYASADNILFRQAIYRADAKLYLHQKLANVVLLAAQSICDRHGYKVILYDGLRTQDAQEHMLQTRRVKENPHWLEAPALLSSPGSGAHPRAMAIDMALLNERGELIDMGTPFDYLAENPDKNYNPAHREYIHLAEDVRKNRTILTAEMLNAAGQLGVDILPLPQEWWDFRLLRDEYERYAPLTEGDLPNNMRLLS